MLGSDRLVSPLSSRVAPNRYGSEEGDEPSTRVQFRLTSPAELAMLPDFSEFDVASMPQATDHINVRSRPTDSAATAGGTVDLQQRIQAQGTAQDLAAAAETRQRSPQGSTRSELSSRASDHLDPADEQLIRARSAHRQRDSSIRQSTISTLAWQQAEGKRQP